jgi:hypothetical protein
MTKLYKLTDQDNRTYNKTLWGPNVTHKTSGKGKLCGPGWLHAYTSWELALLLNPIHANFHKPRLWLAEGSVGKTDRGLKVGTSQLTTLMELPIPTVSNEQRAVFALLCAKVVYKDSVFVDWATDWILGKGRTAEAAAEAAARTAARTAALTAARATWTARTAWAAARAAEAAVRTAWATALAAEAAARTAEAALAAARTAARAAEAAWATAEAAWTAARTAAEATEAEKLDLDQIAKTALSYQNLSEFI